MYIGTRLTCGTSGQELTLMTANGSAAIAELMVRPSPGAQCASLVVIILPFAGLVTAIALLWGVGFSWLHLGLLLGGYVLTAFGITVGYHRLFTHRSFRTSRPSRLSSESWARWPSRVPSSNG